MEIIKHSCGPLGANCYLLIKGDKAVAIDVSDYKSVKKLAENKKVNIEYIILTHGHFDHASGCAEFQRDRVKIGISEEDYTFTFNSNNLAENMGFNFNEFRSDFTFKGGDKLNLCDIEINVIATPGHTVGSVCFEVGDALFTGDTLFCHSIGRSDFPTGNYSTLVKSIKEKLFSLKGNRQIYPGHEEETTLEIERWSNPFVI